MGIAISYQSLLTQLSKLVAILSLVMKRLRLSSPEEYAVTQKNDTELCFSNRYWDKFDAGIYVDAVTGGTSFFSSKILLTSLRGYRVSPVLSVHRCYDLQRR